MATIDEFAETQLNAPQTQVEVPPVDGQTAGLLAGQSASPVPPVEPVPQLTPPPKATAEVRQIDQPTQTVAGQITGLLNKDSDYMKRNKTMGLAAANERGMLNTTMGQQMGQAAAIDAALPIAQQDASTYFEQSNINQMAENDFELFNTELGWQDYGKDRDFAIETAKNTQQNKAAMELQTLQDAGAWDRTEFEGELRLQLDQADTGRLNSQMMAESIQQTLDNYQRLALEVASNADLSTEAKIAALDVLADTRATTIDLMSDVTGYNMDFNSTSIDDVAADTGWRLSDTAAVDTAYQETTAEIGDDAMGAITGVVGQVIMDEGADVVWEAIGGEAAVSSIFGEEVAAQGAAEVMAGTGDVAVGTEGAAGAEAGSSALGVVAVIAAVVIAQNKMTEMTDTTVEGHETGNIFSGDGATEPWFGYMSDKFGWEPTAGENFDAAVANEEWGTVAARWPAAFSYWADPATAVVTAGVKNEFGTDAAYLVNPGSALADALGGSKTVANAADDIIDDIKDPAGAAKSAASNVASYAKDPVGSASKAIKSVSKAFGW